jgi:UDP-2,4-diacetamido-2,4,6-trideoxy-beta-L-altropyranose hydrolase
MVTIPDIAFRTDASLEIGTGHVMRCLTLARGLREAGATCRFITRALPGHLGPRIRAEGFDLTLLPPPNGPAPQAPPAHACFAGVEWARDAAETRAALDPAPGWLVMDHYAFDASWQEAALPRGTRLMVIDDLADRRHRCDLLLDQNLGRNARDYDGLVRDGCTRLIGPQFALLRPEFAERRARALVARGGRGLRHLLITMGGMDPQDATSGILAALKAAPLPRDMRITVIMGGKAPALGRVRKLAADMPWPTEVAVDVSDMAVRMEAADLAIGAGGSTTWERCALGLPSIIVQIAENQAGIARAMVKAGAALDPGPITAPDFAPRLRDALTEAQDRLEELAQQAVLICDGHGLARVMALLMRAILSFRPATESDSTRICEWRAASGLEKYSLRGEVTPFADHHAWFTRALHDPRRSFRIQMLGPLPCGYLRLDRGEDSRARVSICLAPDARGKGLAESLLAEAACLGRSLGLIHLDAEIHPQNEASLRCFERAGYVRGADIGEFRTYTLTLREER